MAQTNIKIPPRYLPAKLEEIRAFAFYVKLKKIYESNGVIYNYDPKTLSPKIKVSPYLIKKYVSVLKEMKIAFYRDNHLCLIGLRKLAMTLPEGSRYRKEVDIHSNDTIQIIVTKLRYLALKDKLIDSHKWYSFIRNEMNKSGSLNKLKQKIKKYPSLKESVRKCDEVIHAGYRKISKITGLSICQVKKFLLTLKRWQYIKDFKEMVEEFGVYIDCCTFEKSIGSRNCGIGYIYNTTTTTYISHGTEIILIPD